MNDDWKLEVVNLLNQYHLRRIDGSTEFIAFIESLLQKQRDEFVENLLVIKQCGTLGAVDAYCNILINKLEGIK